MRLTRMLLGVFAAVLAGPALSAQAPVSEMDAHIAAAKAAAGLDYRATFVNLCLPGREPGARQSGGWTRGWRGAAGGRGARGGGAEAPARRRIAPRGTPRHTRCSTTSTGSARGSIRRGRCARATGLIIIDTNFAWATQPEIIDGLTDARTRSAANQIRRHQPRARRPRSGRRGTAEAIRRQGGDGRGRLGVDAAAARDRRRRRADARRRRRSATA